MWITEKLSLHFYDFSLMLYVFYNIYILNLDLKIDSLQIGPRILQFGPQNENSNHNVVPGAGSGGDGRIPTSRRRE